MNSKKGRLFFVTLLALAIALFYSTNNSVEAGKKNTSSGSGWHRWNNDDGSSGHKGHGKSHDDDSSSGHMPKKKKKPKREWLTRGNANIDSEKHFLGTTDEADLVIKTNNTEKARVTIDGDVGIGTATPTGTLHVNGGEAAADTDGKDVTVEAQDGGPTTGAGGNIILTPGTDGDGTSSGTVYIGEIDILDPPMLTLDVNGLIRIRGGSPFIGAVLTSDSFGNASWQSVNVNDADSDPANELQTLSQSGNSVTLSNGGGTVTVADNDNDSSNELQVLNQTGNNVTLSNGGGTISVDDGDSDSTNELQSLSSSTAGTSRTIDISGGTGTIIDVADNDDDSANEIQTLSFTSPTLSILSGNSVDLSGLSDTDWTESGSNVYRLSGNVGIGTSSPGSLLHVSGPSNNKFVGLTLDDSATGFERQWFIGTNFTPDKLNFRDNTAGANRMVIDSSGNVGIGTINPVQKFDVAGTVNATSYLGDGSGLTGVDTSTTNELNTAANLTGTNLNITDAGGTLTVGLGSLVNDADADPVNEIQNLTSSSSGINRTINIDGGGTGTTIDVADNDNSDLNEIQTMSQVGNTVTLSNGGGTISVADGDSNALNEINTGASLIGNSLGITDAGGTVTVDLGSLAHLIHKYNLST